MRERASKLSVAPSPTVIFERVLVVESSLLEDAGAPAFLTKTVCPTGRKIPLSLTEMSPVVSVPAAAKVPLVIVAP